MNKRRNLIINIIVISFILVMAVATVLIFTLAGKPEIQDMPKLSLYGLQYSPTSMTVTAVVGFAINDTPIGECDEIKKDSWNKQDFWFGEAYTKYTLDTQGIISSCNKLIKDEDLITKDGTVYPRDGIDYEFIFHTRYKSIRGGQISRSDVGYLHSFIIDEEDEFTEVVLYNRYPETANWYSILAVIGIVIIGVAVVISCLILRNNDYNN